MSTLSTLTNGVGPVVKGSADWLKRSIERFKRPFQFTKEVVVAVAEAVAVAVVGVVVVAI